MSPIWIGRLIYNTFEIPDSGKAEVSTLNSSLKKHQTFVQNCSPKHFQRTVLQKVPLLPGTALKLLSCHNAVLLPDQIFGVKDIISCDRRFDPSLDSVEIKLLVIRLCMNLGVACDFTAVWGSGP